MASTRAVVVSLAYCELVIATVMTLTAGLGAVARWMERAV